MRELTIRTHIPPPRCFKLFNVQDYHAMFVHHQVFIFHEVREKGREFDVFQFELFNVEGKTLALSR